MKFLNMGMVGMLTFAGSSQAKKPTLHLIGIFHTIPSNEFSHCAFTGHYYDIPPSLTYSPPAPLARKGSALFEDDADAGL